MNKQIEVTCSPGTFQRIQDDDAYRSQVYDKVMMENNVDRQNIIITSTPYDELNNSAAPAQEEWSTQPGNSADEMFAEIQRPPSPKPVWLEAPTKLLLALLRELQAKVGKCVQFKNKAKMWSVIEQRMTLKGYNFSTSQIENKFRTLERQFKRISLHNNRTGSNRQVCPYESELNELLGKKHNLHPVYVLDNTSIDCSELSENVGSGLDQTICNDDTPSSSNDTQVSIQGDDGCSPENPAIIQDDTPGPPPVKERPANSRGKAMQALLKIQEKQEEFNEKMSIYFEKKEQRAQKKEERAERREQIAKKKIRIAAKLGEQASQMRYNLKFKKFKMV